MSATDERRRLYARAVDRALAWILSRQEPDGGFGAIEDMSPLGVLGATLLYTGHGDAALRFMPYLARRFRAPDGSLNPPEIAERKPGPLREARYGSAWIAYSAHVNLAFDLSLPAMPAILRFQDPVSGGLFGPLADGERGRGIIHAGVTGVAGLAALCTGHLNAAIRMGNHLVDNVIAKQPDLVRAFYPAWDTERGLLTDGSVEAAPNMPPVIRADGPKRDHFLAGLFLGFLTDLYRATRASKYLDGALAVYEFTCREAAGVFDSSGFHKFAWGCAWLYRQTADARHLETACQVCDYLLTLQDADGSFVHRAFVPSLPQWPYAARLNTTAQFSLWIWRTLAVL